MSFWATEGSRRIYTRNDTLSVKSRKRSFDSLTLPQDDTLFWIVSAIDKQPSMIHFRNRAAQGGGSVCCVIWTDDFKSNLVMVRSVKWWTIIYRANKQQIKAIKRRKIVWWPCHLCEFLIEPSVRCLADWPFPVDPGFWQAHWVLVWEGFLPKAPGASVHIVCGWCW